ncbi:V protein [Measles morbillivirus]|uniref:Non-structural protein V n=2 Tax=Measles morbillivirus TaxID=11234 RepID=V_MEASC|nr:V protein [Measles morbillivirus]P0C774.1 RecName: Full=Non-structural protein V [Measles virus strain Ichinose-B95a]QWT51380.1 V protein [Measles morbillivirus]BBG06472.1 V protein [Measles morbillivirus]
MAEEQARHVKNGLECIRALKAEPIGSLAVEEAMAAWSEISDNPGQDRATCKEEEAGSSGLSKPCLSAIGSTEGGAPRIRGQGSGESDDDAETLGIPSRNLQASSTGLQCYHVYDHSGEAVKGIQDADSIMVQSGLDGDSTLSGGDDESENSDVDIGEPDTEGYAITDRGSAPISMGFRASDVETAEGGEIHELLKLQSRGNNFPKLGKTLNVPPPPNPSRASTSETPIKKGHRREIGLIWNGDRVFIDRWCNPMCSKVTLGTIRARCTCGECPRVCEQCRTDTGVDTRIWYHNLPEIPE